MARSVWKGPYIDEWLGRKLDKANHELKEKGFARPIWVTRRCTIIPECQGFNFHVHNGKALINVEAKESMIGHKFGEFVPTKKPVHHAGDKKDKKR